MQYTLWAMERIWKRSIARLILFPITILTYPIATALDWMARKAWEWKDW